MTSPERRQYVKRMVCENMSATRVQKMEAARTMQFGDLEPASLPTLNALRIMKCRTLQSNRLDGDPILSIIKMKENAPYNTILQDIGYDPFFLHYWSAAQINAYRLYTTQTRVSRISIDATGSVIKPIHLLSGWKTRALFLLRDCSE